jgi:hypothetical protein
VAADTTRRQTRLDAVATELAHRQALPTGVAEAVEAARAQADAARAAEAERHQATLSRGHDHRYDPGPTHRGPSLGR